MKKFKHYFYVPFTGLGLYNGWRGERWFRNRIKIFKQFVVPSLLAQTDKDFSIWISFTRHEKGHKLVEELDAYLTAMRLPHVFTYHGVCFYDDKYGLTDAKIRLAESLHGSIGELLDDIGDVEEVYMTIQPSDDCYLTTAAEIIHKVFRSTNKEAVGFKHGYICNYLSLEVSEYNPTTNPPFYTIKFPKEIFIDPIKHIQHTGLKRDVGDYPVGTPLPSHEYVGYCVDYKQLETRGFLVGTHSENISTYYDHPFKGDKVNDVFLDCFGLEDVEPLKLKFSLRKRILRKLPHKVQRKLRYIFGEKFFSKIYNWLRG